VPASRPPLTLPPVKSGSKPRSGILVPNQSQREVLSISDPPIHSRLREARGALGRPSTLAATALSHYQMAYQTAADISFAQDQSALLKSTRDLFTQLYPDDQVWLCLLEGRRLKLRRFLVTGDLEGHEDILDLGGRGIVNRVVETGEAVVVDDVGADPAYIDLSGGSMKSELAVPLRAGGRLFGVLNLESPHPQRYALDDRVLVTGIAAHLGVALAHLDQQKRLHKSILATVRTLSEMVESKDDYTEGHCQRIAKLATATGTRLGLKESAADTLYYAGLLHDIGKVAVPDAILKKPGRLTEGEFTVIKTHPGVGRRLLEGLPGLTLVARIVEQHHERWDGGGYPLGLSGEGIGLEARIISVADAYDAMTTTRPYRDSLGHAEAIRRLRDGAATQFDPTIVDVFLDVVTAQEGP